jgi:hypothetical protein
MGCNQVELFEELLHNSEQFYTSFPADLDLLITEGQKLSPKGSLSKMQQGCKSIPPHLVRNRPDFIKVSTKDISFFLRHNFLSIGSSDTSCYSEFGENLEYLTPSDYCLKFNDETELRIGVSEIFNIVRVDSRYKSERFGGGCDPCNINISIDDIFAPESVLISISHILKCGDKALGDAGIVRPVWMSNILWVINKVWYGVFYEKNEDDVVAKLSPKEKKEIATHNLKFYMQKTLSDYLVKVILQIVLSNKSSINNLTNLAKNFSFELHSSQPEFLRVINGLAESFWDKGIKGIAESKHWEAARIDVSQKYGFGKRVAEHLDDIIIRDR